jgi:hypothetical protein
MSWLGTIGIGLLTAIIGVFGVGTLGALCVDWYRITGREAGSAYFVVLLGLLGGVGGLILGIVGARIVAAGAEPSFLKALGVVTGSSVGLLLIATFICWFAADLDTTLGGKPVQLHAELRCPPGFVIPDDATDAHWYAHIDTRSRRQTSRAGLRLDDARTEDGRLVIPMTLPLLTSVREKLLYVRLAENVQLFIPVFSSKPGKRFFSWSEWQDGGWEPGKPRPEPPKRFNIRFRLEVVEPPESFAETQAKKLEADTATLAGLTVDSPFEELLKFTHYSHAEDRRRAAGALLGQRPRLITEMSAQILSPDREIAKHALRAVAYIRPLPPELAAPVSLVGEQVIAEIEKFTAADSAANQSYYKGADVASSLFSAWHEAILALHQVAGVDQVPQLKKVLDLSLKREDSHVMKDVARIADFYVTKWSNQAVAR